MRYGKEDGDGMMKKRERERKTRKKDNDKRALADPLTAVRQCRKHAVTCHQLSYVPCSLTTPSLTNTILSHIIITGTLCITINVVRPTSAPLTISRTAA